MIVDVFTAASSTLELMIFTFYAYLESVLFSTVSFLRDTVGGSTGIEIVCEDGFAYCTKTERIERCLSKNDDSINLWELRELALSDGGLLEAKYRKKAWKLLVGMRENDVIPELKLCRTRSKDELECESTSHSSLPMDENEEKKSESVLVSEDLIRRDAGRSVIFHFNDIDDNDNNPKITSISPPYASERLTRVLVNTINQENTHLYYYQGFHDVAGVILHHVEYDEVLTTEILKQISRSHLRDAMKENFSQISWLLSVLLPPLVEKIDPFVSYALLLSQVDLATICLPWIITWFAHDIHDPVIAGNLFDAFLSGHPLMPIYFAIALITHPILKKDILEADSHDPASFFMLIKVLPLKIKSKQRGNNPHHQGRQITVSLQEILEDSISIMNRIPPRSLLDIIDTKLYSRKDLLQRISSISLFKAPASWSMNSGGLPRSWKELNDVQGTMYCVRSKLASGVPMLMNTVSESPVISRRSWGSRKYSKRKKTLKMRKLIRVILGKSRNKSS